MISHAHRRHSTTPLLDRHGLFIGVVALALLLAGCGYRPLYGEVNGASVNGALASISIPEPKTRVEQLIRNELISTISPAGSGGGGAYLLEIVPEEKNELAIEEFNTDDIRRTVKLRATFRLIDKAAGKAIYSGKSFSQVSYDRVNAPFSDYQARTNAEERAAKEIGGDISTRLAAFFASRS